MTTPHTPGGIGAEDNTMTKVFDVITKTVMWLILLTPILGITVLIIADLLSDEDEGW